MLTNWFSQPAGTRSSTDDPRGPDAEDDTLVMEPDQGNGEPLLRFNLRRLPQWLRDRKPPPILLTSMMY